MELDNQLFKSINTYKIPTFLDEVLAYLHGFRNLEIVFFLFCAVLLVIVLTAPRRGPRAAVAVFIAAMITFLGASSLRKFFIRPYPEFNETLDVVLRVEFLRAQSAFPVVSNTMFAAIAMTILFYFPKNTATIVFLSVLYAIMPVYLGAAYPSDAFLSLLFGYVLGYVLMTFLSQHKYFSRY